MKSTRGEVYQALDSERSYQNYRWAGHEHSITEYLLCIDYYLTKAKAIVSTSVLEDDALDAIRKITALGVAAMEENGAKPRAGW